MTRAREHRKATEPDPSALSSSYDEHRGLIEVITGGMFSGKTDELLRRLTQAQLSKYRVQAFKSGLDTRYDLSAIVSHNGNRTEAITVTSSKEVLDKVLSDTHVLGIDEAQFLDAGLVGVADALACRGVRVIVAGLDQDYLGRPFAPLPELMALAESVTKLRAICAVCGYLASRSQRIAPVNTPILVGASGAYEPRCRRCFDPKVLPSKDSI